MPSILFINRVYPPSDGATGVILERIAKGFVEEGWDVTVLATSSPLERNQVTPSGGVKLIHCDFVFSKKHTLMRALGYALMVPTLMVRAALLPSHNIVVTMTDPPMLLLIGPILRLIKGSRLIHWAQDLYPEVAEVAGILPFSGAMAGVLRWISTKAIRSYDLVVVVGRCMADRFADRGIDKNKIRIIPNVEIARDIMPVNRRENKFRHRHGFDNEFLVVYSGNMGRAHDFSTILDVAETLQKKGETDILFLMIGSGAGEKSIHEEVQRRNLSCFRFFPMQPSHQLSESLGAGDLHLVTVREGMSGLVVPSKFYGVLAAARPCIFIGPKSSEVALAIQEQQIGSSFMQGDTQGILAAILEYRNYPQHALDSGSRARKYFLETLSNKAFFSAAQEVINTFR